MSAPETYQPKCACGAVLVEVAESFYVCEDRKYPHVWKGYAETYPGGSRQLVNADRDAIPLALAMLKNLTAVALAAKVATSAGRYPALVEALAVDDYDYEMRFYCETAEGSHNDGMTYYDTPEEAIERAKILSYDDDAWGIFQVRNTYDDDKEAPARQDRAVAIVYGQRVFIWNGEEG